jgi:prophage regulatory protein
MNSYKQREMRMNTNSPVQVLLRRRDVEARTGLKRSALYKLMTEGTFPAQVKLGIGACVAWIQSDVDQWIQDQIDNGRHILPKKLNATENFLRTQLEKGALAEPILRERAHSYGISWDSIEQARSDGLVTSETVGDMTAPRWSLT